MNAPLTDLYEAHYGRRPQNRQKKRLHHRARQQTFFFKVTSATSALSSVVFVFLRVSAPLR
jgi:hypothetical protein